jgi:hypothetical protein
MDIKMSIHTNIMFLPKTLKHRILHGGSQLEQIFKNQSESQSLKTIAQLSICPIELDKERKLTGDKLKVVRAKFFTLSSTVLL